MDIQLKKPKISPWIYAGLIKGEYGLKDEDYLLEQVSQFYGISKEEILGKKRDRPIIIARHSYILLMKKFTKLTLKQMGFACGFRDHSTCINAITAIENYIDTDKRFRDEFNQLLAKL